LGHLTACAALGQSHILGAGHSNASKNKRDKGLAHFPERINHDM
jgi:hypothetical protein